MFKFLRNFFFATREPDFRKNRKLLIESVRNSNDFNMYCPTRCILPHCRQFCNKYRLDPLEGYQYLGISKTIWLKITLPCESTGAYYADAEETVTLLETVFSFPQDKINNFDPNLEWAKIMNRVSEYQDHTVKITNSIRA